MQGHVGKSTYCCRRVICKTCTRHQTLLTLHLLFPRLTQQNGSYKAALAHFESILSDILGRYDERHDRVGAALHNVAIANLRAGSLDDAMDAIEEAIKIRSRALGRTHPKVAVSDADCNSLSLLESIVSCLAHMFIILLPYRTRWSNSASYCSPWKSTTMP
jgi:hypothetical protein